MEQLISLTNELRALRARFASEGREALRAGFDKFFAENPTITSVTWNQGTPSFNDGDPCTFSVHEIHSVVIGEDEFDAYDDQCPASVRELSNVLRTSSDVLEAVFGDGSEVTAARGGFDVEDYYDD